MKDAGFPLRQAYKELLTGMTYQGQPVPLYDLLAPSGASGYYIILGPWQSRSDNTKDSFGQAGQINLDVVTRFGVGFGSDQPGSEIANLVTGLLKPTLTAEVLNVPGFQSCITLIVGVTPLPEQKSTTGTIIRKIITVSHVLCQQ